MSVWNVLSLSSLSCVSVMWICDNGNGFAGLKKNSNTLIFFNYCTLHLIQQIKSRLNGVQNLDNVGTKPAYIYSDVHRDAADDEFCHCQLFVLVLKSSMQTLHVFLVKKQFIWKSKSNQPAKSSLKTFTRECEFETFLQEHGYPSNTT